SAWPTSGKHKGAGRRVGAEGGEGGEGGATAVGETAAVASWNSPVARVSPVHSRRTSSLSPSRRAASYLLVIRL
ncbi:MAG: hypothetical protein KJ048_01770, partial [Dehalococcoidia bacterium]|nr:hypothetical protein [Dehalococcoidia bacterium]